MRVAGGEATSVPCIFGKLGSRGMLDLTGADLNQSRLSMQEEWVSNLPIFGFHPVRD
jgi:hypothetical protein